MGWIIDFDVHGDRTQRAPCNANATGLTGPEAYAPDDPRLKHKFRLKDGDGEIYYYGRSFTCDDDDAFEPLDGFGMPNAGCTDIEYYNGETWEVL